MQSNLNTLMLRSIKAKSDLKDRADSHLSIVRPNFPRSQSFTRKYQVAAR